jgi:hypothetical protein
MANAIRLRKWVTNSASGMWTRRRIPRLSLFLKTISCYQSRKELWSQSGRHEKKGLGTANEQSLRRNSFIKFRGPQALRDRCERRSGNGAEGRFHRCARFCLLAGNGQHGRGAFRPGRQGEEICRCRVSRVSAAPAHKAKGAKPVCGSPLSVSLRKPVCKFKRSR